MAAADGRVQKRREKAGQAAVHTAKRGGVDCTDRLAEGFQHTPAGGMLFPERLQVERRTVAFRQPLGGIGAGQAYEGLVILGLLIFGGRPGRGMSAKHYS